VIQPAGGSAKHDPHDDYPIVIADTIPGQAAAFEEKAKEAG
jgi:hypothetical protein